MPAIFPSRRIRSRCLSGALEVFTHFKSMGGARLIFTLSVGLLTLACNGQKRGDASDGATGGDNPGGAAGTGGTAGAGGAGATAGSGASSGNAGTAGGGSECAEPLTWCADQCVDLGVTTQHCGACSNACPEGDVCQDGSCLAIEDCTETPCPGLNYCDLLTKKCKPGCIEDAQCPEDSKCETTTRECLCNSGRHECGGRCFPNDDPAHCGAACNVCPPLENGPAVCTDGSCVQNCDPGFHRCGLQCVADTDPNFCGATCTTCPPVANGTATCVDGSCSASCSPGSHLCGSQCVLDTDPNFCGPECQACEAPNNGNASCVDNACVSECSDGFETCFDSCTHALGEPCEGNEDCCGKKGYFCDGLLSCDLSSYKPCASDDECMGYKCNAGDPRVASGYCMAPCNIETPRCPTFLRVSQVQCRAFDASGDGYCFIACADGCPPEMVCSSNAPDALCDYPQP